MAAFDEDGKALWGRVLGEVVGEAEESVAAFPDGGAVVTAHLDQTATKQFGGFVVTRFDAAGGITWTKEIGATAEAAVAITSDASGIILAGGLVRSLPLEGCPLGDVPAEVGDAGVEAGSDAGDGGLDAGPPPERADAFVAKLSAAAATSSWGRLIQPRRAGSSFAPTERRSSPSSPPTALTSGAAGSRMRTPRAGAT